MRNIVGQPVSGKDFFKRDVIINKIYRRLDSGSHLFMAAPRRVGKTSIMYYLNDNPRDGYAFIYVNTESIEDPELYYKKLFEALLNSDAVTEAVKRSAKSKALFETVTDRVKKIGLFGFEIELNEKKEGKYSEEFAALVKQLDTDGFKIIMMVDEFPSTVENIHHHHGEAKAIQFLKHNRTIRQESGGCISFIYTGSIGLPVIVNRLDEPESINDLNPVEIPPLSITEGRLFVQKLLSSADVPIDDIKTAEYLLEKVRWLMPFFIQLAIQELVDEYDSNQKIVTNEVVDIAFEKICNRRNNTHFDSYYNRLKDAFSREDYTLVIKILNAVAGQDSIEKEELAKLDDNARRLNSILESLEYDGYINRTNGHYRFNSPILQRWWNKYIRE